MIRKMLFIAAHLFFFGAINTVRADEILIMDDDFNKYLRDARPGDVFTVFPGVYKLKNIVKMKASGTAKKPIIIKPSLAGAVKIIVPRSVGFKVFGKHWTIQDFNIVGMCNTHNDCDHAFHIVGNADHTVIRGNTMIDFNAAIKANGSVTNGVRLFPDDVLIEDNHMFNNSPRQTAKPVVPIDVVGGRRWVVRDNFIADFEKAIGNKVSMAAFLKGNSDSGLFERNLVICEWQHKGGVRLGLSFGGGGTGQAYCQGGNCKFEHYMGVIRGNIIMNCPADVGIYLNKSANTQIINNTILNTTGIDVRFGTSFAAISNNVIEGRIKDRDGGSHYATDNVIEKSFEDVFPGRGSYDLTPADSKELRGTDRDYEGVDFCTGDTQGAWKGAISQPAQCRIQDKLNEVIVRQAKADR